MATGGKLEVQIGADITDFDKKIKEVESDIRELSKVKLDQLKLGLDTKEINAQIKDAKNSLATLKDSVGKTGAAIGGQFTKQTANGSNALMQFSRIAQDAPYGIIGIGNNITATAESFGYLKQQTGSTSGALKAMASSLMGTGGILLGVSLLTTGFTLLSQSGLSVGDIIDKVTGKFDAFGDAIKKASEEGVKATAGEVFGLKALVTASQNKALSDKDRLIAVDNLQKQYPAYFGNLSKEQIMTSNLTGVVNELSKALVARATAEKLAGASADIQLSIYKKNAELVKQKSITKEISDETDRLVKTARASGSSQEYINSLYKGGRDAIAETLQAEKEIRSEIISGTKALERRQNVINQLTASSLKLEQQQTGSGKKAPETFNTPQVSGIQSFITPLELTPVIDTAKIATSMKMITSIISKESIRAMEAMLQFNENINAIIEDSFVSTFGNLGTVIGDALASGANVLEAVGNSLMASLGNLLSSLGTELIKLGTAAVLAGTVVKLFGTVSGIGAGLLAIAGGTALKGIGAAMSKGANDRANGNTSSATGQGANNTSTTSGSGTGWSGGANGTVVFEIAGTSLIGVLNNTTERNLRIGGR